MIDKFEGEFEFLSNFAPSTFTFEGITYPTNEHFFQAMKTNDLGMRKAIAAAKTPGAAKRMGRQVQLRPDWERVKVDIMRTGLRCKFEHPILAQKLINTGNELLVEGNWWGDRFWGQCDGTGRNMLGQLLMELREELKVNE